MRIGLTARGSTVDELTEQASQAERDGFHSIWYAYLTDGDPLAAMAVAGRATSSIELGTAVLQTYPCHPLLQANRASSVVDAMGRPGLTIGVGPSHKHIIEDVYGLSYEHPGRSTEEYVRILYPLLQGQDVDFDGQDWSVRSAHRAVPPVHPITVLVSALSPRLLRLAGSVADGTIVWMATAEAIESYVAPRITNAAADAGRPAPRIVAGLPVAVHDDDDEAREAAVASTAAYAEAPNYKRILSMGGVPNAASAAIVGSAASVHRQLRSLAEAGATDVWAGIFPAGEDAAGSVRRTYEVLAEFLG
jgi:F420-dependent oxidoreductase-like protein